MAKTRIVAEEAGGASRGYNRNGGEEGKLVTNVRRGEN